MKTQTKETTLSAQIQRTAAAPAGPSSIEDVAQKYIDLKKEAERLEMEMGLLKGVLLAKLPKFPGKQVEVRVLEDGHHVQRHLYLCPTESKSFDLAAAEEELAEAAIETLEPFIKTERSFRLKAAEEVGFDLKKFKKYIAVTRSVQIRTKKIKAGDE